MTVYIKEELCPGPRLCVSFELCELERQRIPRNGRGQALESEELNDWVKKWKSNSGKPWGYDDKGFYYCTYCRKPRLKQLVQCPNCGNYFMGPRPDLSIDYECENCE